MNDEIDVFFISQNEEGERLDKILASRLQKAGSRTYFQYLIDEGKVLVNGAPVKKRAKPKAGDEIEVEYVCAPELTLVPENLPLDIIYEDDHLLVVNKAAGMVVHPAPGNWTGTFVNALLYHCRELQARGNLEGKQTIRPGIVHRLDKDTTGLLIAAKTAVAQQRLIEMFTNRQIHKEYLAICVGNPGEGKIEEPIGRHPIHRQKMSVREDGRYALTWYHTLAHDSYLSFVRVEIATGRTHQIRVHMKHIGHPVLGDAVYGHLGANAKYGADRQLLHAYRLSFSHPITSDVLDFQAPIPRDMAAQEKAIKK